MHKYIINGKSCGIEIVSKSNMDIIYLHDLKVETIIGVFDWERCTTQVIIIDLDMQTDIRKSAKTDSIEDTLNYKAVAKRVIEYVENSQFQLVETLAEHVAEILLKDFDIEWLRVRVNKKGAVRGAGDVGVIIERGVRA